MRAAHEIGWSGRLAAVATAAWMALAGAAAASTPTASDCTEGAEFIGNAARARDTGMKRSAFIGQMEADFTAIRSFPNELRWFAHDELDESFLLGAARDVFDRPLPPASHQIEFFRACMSRRFV